MHVRREPFLFGLCAPTQNWVDRPKLFRIDRKKLRPLGPNNQDLSSSFEEIPWANNCPRFDRMTYRDILRAIFFDQNTPEMIKEQADLYQKRKEEEDSKEKEEKKEEKKEEEDGDNYSSSSEEEEDDDVFLEGWNIWYDERGIPTLKNICLMPKGTHRNYKNCLEIPISSKLTPRYSG